MQDAIDNARDTINDTINGATRFAKHVAINGLLYVVHVMFNVSVVSGLSVMFVGSAIKSAGLPTFGERVIRFGMGFITIWRVSRR